MLHRTLLTSVSLLALAMTACSSDTNKVTSRPTRPVLVTGGASAAPAGTSPTASSSGPAQSSSAFVIASGGTPASSGAAGAPLKEGQCARKDVSATRIIPTVWLVVDGSGSMVSLLDGTDMSSPSRWDALRGALMDPQTGLVKSLEHQVKFGMVMFDGPIPGNLPIALPDGGIAMFSTPPATTCPRVVDVEPALNNFMAIDTMYPTTPLGGSTPTDKALEQVISHLPDTSQAGPDTQIQPTIVVLATDGEPNDYCSDSLFPPDVRPNVVNAVKKLVANGNKTYVISLAGSDPGLMQFCGQVAQAGGTGKPAYVPSSRDALIQAFRDIIGPGVACDVHLDGMVKMGMECKGKVQLDGMDLPCDSDNGWRLKDMSTLSITGTACDKMKAEDNAYLHADFPCEVFALN